MPEARENDPSRLRVVLLAPTTIVGGITTWARFLLKHNDPARVRYKVIDTSRLFVPLGHGRLGPIGILCGLRDAATRFGAILGALRSFRPDLVYFTCAPSIGLVRDALYILLLRRMGVPAVVHLHGGNVEGFFGGPWWRRRIVHAALRRCRAVLVITRECERAARELFGPDRVVYVPNMIGDDLVARVPRRRIRPADSPGPWRLLHVGWQNPVKGTLDLMEAVRYVRRPVECHLVGDVPPRYAPLYRSRLRDLSLEERVRLTGILRGKALRREFDEADLFVFPTHREGPEGFPMVILEAMTYGIPIVANEVGNIREMIGADTDRPAGILLEQVDPIDPKELAEKIDALIEDAPLRRRLSENGRWRVATHYLGSKVVPELVELLRDLTFRPPGQRHLHRWGRVGDR